MSYNWEISFVKYPMEILGLWPDNKLLNNLKFMISLLFTLTTLLPCFLSLFFIKSDDDLMNIIIYCGTFFIGVVEIIIFKYKKYNIIYILNLVMKNWQASDDYSHHHSVMIKHGHLGKKIILITYVIMLASYIGKYLLKKHFYLLKFKDNNLFIYLIFKAIFYSQLSLVLLKIQQSKSLVIVYGFHLILNRHQILK